MTMSSLEKMIRTLDKRTMIQAKMNYSETNLNDKSMRTNKCVQTSFVCSGFNGSVYQQYFYRSILILDTNEVCYS